MGIAAGKAIGDHEPAAITLEGFDEQVVEPWKPRSALLDLQPFANLAGHFVPAFRGVEQPAHPGCKIGAQRHATADIGRHAGYAAAQLDMDVGAFEARHFQRQPGKHEAVAGAQLPAEPFLDLAEPLAPPPEADRHRHRLHDGPRIQPVLGGKARVGQAPLAGLVLGQPLVAIIGTQAVAPGGDKTEHFVEASAGEAGIGRGAADFGIKRVGEERRRGSDAEDMLGQDIEAAGTKDIGIEFARQHGIASGERFEIFEAIARHDQCVAGFVHTVVGAAGALKQARRSLGGAHLHDEIDIAPIDAEIEAGGGDDGAQAAGRHGVFGLAPGFGRQ